MTIMAKRTLAMLAAVILVVGAIAAYKIRTVQTLRARAAAAVYPPAMVSTAIAPATVWQRQFHSVGSLATAQLSGLQAQADLALLTLNRARELRAKDTNSQADLDSAEALCRESSSAVENERALIGKKTIRAPFSGVLGIRQVNLGQFLPAGAPIVTLQTLDPIYVNFSLPQQDVGDLHAGQTVRMTVDAFPGVAFEGKVNALNSTVDEATRNIQVQATVRNADERLVPGMFAGVDLILPREDRFVTLPETAIVYNPYGAAVYVVERTKTESGGQLLVARQHFVTLGETRGDQVAVVKGVNAGDEVVTAGQLKLRNGSPVAVDNAAQPASNPAPVPPNT